ncbi:MAG: alpha/beta hydrolase [Gammaproteobacteria bacterium]|nr:alpha/beta hydrolase [Gammaproteobacteria bacterium]
MGSGHSSRDALSLRGPAGRIEGLLDMPVATVAPAVAVVCHPHPQHQGTQLNKVVHTISRSMNELGAPAIRFNFRGVGASEGVYGDGWGETEDVIAVAEWARHRFPQAELWLAGFSFGAAVAIRAAAQLQPARLISVAPPVVRMAGLLDDARPTCPWIIVQGTDDEVVGSGDVQQWAQSRHAAAELVMLPEVGHFFHGRLTLLRETLTAWVTGSQPAGPAG